MKKKNNINNIRRKKNGGDIIIEPLINGFDDLNDGDEYVYVGKHNKVLLWGSEKAKETDIAKVIWDYNVKNRYFVVNKFDEGEFQRYKEYISEYNMVNGLDLKDHLNYEAYTECQPATLNQFIDEAKEHANFCEEMGYPNFND